MIMNKMKKNIPIVLVLFLINCMSLQAQELSYGYYNYVMNRFNLNPALAGNNGNISALLNTKTYQAGFNDAPRNTMFGIHAPLNASQGLGLRVLSDRRGGFELAKYDAVYSYQIKIDERSDLRFGISAGAIRRMLNPNRLTNSELLDESDPNLASGFFDETNFIAGIGLVYDYDNFQLGFSSPHLVDGSNELSQYMVATIGYEYALEDTKLSFTPAFIYHNMPEIDNQYDFLLKAEYNNKVWVQGGYQSTQNINFGLGFDLGAFGVGYSYELNNSNLNNIARNSSEIVITIGFSSQKMKDKEGMLKLLDEYSNKLNRMLIDNQNRYNKGSVMTEIEKIKLELKKLEKQNNKKKAKEVNKRLMLIESQIIALEKKYGK